MQFKHYPEGAFYYFFKNLLANLFIQKLALALVHLQSYTLAQMLCNSGRWQQRSCGQRVVNAIQIHN